MQTQKLVDSFSPENLWALVRTKSKFAVPKHTGEFLIAEGARVDPKFSVNRDFMVIERFPNQPDKSMIIMSIRVATDNLTARSCRRNQYEFARLAVRQCDAPDITPNEVRHGIFVFHDDAGNFRFSLVHNLTQTDTPKPDWSAFRRQTYFVKAGEPNGTFINRMRLPWDSVEDVKNAFSVEALTKEFYGELFKWYQHAVDSPDVFFPSDTVKDKDPGAVKSEQVIRLITRLMFVWFIKQKRLVPEVLFDPDKIISILKDFVPENGDNYYRAILQNLFFATLNSEIENRAFAFEGSSKGENKEHFDIKTLYRYRDHFNVDVQQILDLFKTIPFLNGGLFECLDRGRDYYDGFSRNPEKQARIPNRLFFSIDEAQLGLITILSRYNFTVEENSTGDEDVALDPELLGKVFENLLGAYNPETQVAARNATGSFYTPREIVDYMVDESLIAHLENTCGAEHTAAIHRLFKEGVPPEDNESLCSDLVNKLTSIKILDPACGSGAFPMGALLRIVEILRTLKGLQDQESIYDLKLNLIEQCIFGVDIQCIAVQISKLRFFISLVCEQERTDDATNNYGINPLPNLETKFVAANSLVRLSSGHGILQSADIEDLKARLWEVRHLHFRARTYQGKKKLRTQDGVLRKQLASKLEGWKGFDIDAADSLAGWDPYNQNQSSSFFDAEWMFNITSGFDVVIGNPPYINVQLVSPEDKSYYSHNYSTFFKRYDLFGLFFEAGLTSYTTESGSVTFIVPQQVANNLSFKKLRDMMLNKRWLREVLYLGDRVFTAANNDVCVLHLTKTGNQTIRLTYALDFNQMQSVEVPSNHFFEYGNVISFSSDNLGESIVAKIFSKMNWRIKERFSVFQGIVTGNNPVFLPSAEDILHEGLEKGLLQPVLLGRDFERWAIRNTVRQIIYVDRSTKISFYPNIYKRLERYKSALERRRECRNNTIPWYSLQWPRNRSELDRIPKIVVQATRNQRLSTRVVAALDLQGLYGTQGLNFIVPRKPGYSTHYLLAILNSKVINYLFATKFLNVAIKAEYLKETPIPGAKPSDQNRLEELAKTILDLKKNNLKADVSDMTSEIDALVYKLYGLTAEEIDFLERTGSSEPNIEAEADTEVEEDAAVSDSGADEDAFN